MYLVHFGRSPAAATATAATAAATVPVPQARRRAVPSIGTEASESCNLPRALTLGAAAAAAVVAAACCCLSCFSYFQITNFKIQFSNLQFIAAQVKQTEFCSQFIIYEFILNPYTEFHFVSLLSACRASVSRCSHHTLFSPLLSSLFLVSLFVVRCYRVFRCRWPSSYSLSVEQSQRQWSSPKEQWIYSKHIREIRDLQRYYSLVKRVRVVFGNRNGLVNGEQWKVFEFPMNLMLLFI